MEKEQIKALLENASDDFLESFLTVFREYQSFQHTLNKNYG